MAYYGNLVVLEGPFVTWTLEGQEHLIDVIDFNHLVSRMENPNIPREYSLIIDRHLDGTPLEPGEGAIGWLCVGDDPDWNGWDEDGYDDFLVEGLNVHTVWTEVPVAGRVAWFDPYV